MMEIDGVILDIKIQRNEVNSQPAMDEYARELRSQYLYKPNSWESSSDRYANKDLFVEGFCDILDKNLPKGDWGERIPYSYIVTFHINGFPFILEKYNNRFKLMGKIMTKKEALTAIAKTAMYGGTSKKEGGEVYLFFNKYVETPNLIMRAIEERIEYKFPITEFVDEQVYDYNVEDYVMKTIPKTKYHKVLINVQKVGNKRYALEISDNIWGEMSEKDILAFIKIHNNKKRNVRSKWWKIKPEKLWEYTIGEVPSESQLNTMIQFLLHNRKDKIVIDKSLELVKTLTKFKDIKGSRTGELLKVLVRGNEAYWYIYGTIGETVNGGLQDVSTVLLTEDVDNDITSDGHYDFFNRFTGRDVCIDNLVSGSSIGDQIYSRAMLCMNDTTSKEIINTMKNKLDSWKDELLKIQSFDVIQNIWEEE